MSAVGSPRFQAKWSISASMWSEAQEGVPVPESLASYKNPRPALTAAGVGSVPTGISAIAPCIEVGIIEIVLEMRFREYKVLAAALRASPLGPRRSEEH